MTKPKRTTYEIAVVGLCAEHARSHCLHCRVAPAGRAERTGYVLGGYATSAPEKGEYFYSFTHLETGMSVNVWPCHDTKASALAHLAKLADGTAPQCAWVEATLAKYGRGWGGGAA